jgi:hypothetical protein
LSLFGKREKHRWESEAVSHVGEGYFARCVRCGCMQAERGGIVGESLVYRFPDEGPDAWRAREPACVKPKTP